MVTEATRMRMQQHFRFSSRSRPCNYCGEANRNSLRDSPSGPFFARLPTLTIVTWDTREWHSISGLESAGVSLCTSLPPPVSGRVLKPRPRLHKRRINLALWLQNFRRPRDFPRPPRHFPAAFPFANRYQRHAWNWRAGGDFRQDHQTWIFCAKDIWDFGYLHKSLQATYTCQLFPAFSRDKYNEENPYLCGGKSSKSLFSSTGKQDWKYHFFYPMHFFGNQCFLF